MKLSTFLQGFAYGFISMVFFPLLLVVLNDYFELPIYQFSWFRILGVFCVFAGGITLLYCTRLFASLGKGSPWPLDPPQKLVISGIYHYTRNPQFVASGLIWFGEFLVSGSFLLFWYGLAWVVFNHLLLVLYDEKMLQKKFGNKYTEYRKKTPRYFIW
jgi:protein-S-isoprenylcysteine O-methyltransferase Ste14